MKKKLISLICILIIVQLISCKKDKINNPDVYVAGHVFNKTTGNIDAVIWKNGEKQTMGRLSTQTGSSQATDIFILGNDVFSVGRAFTSSWNVVLWKNGTANAITFFGNNSANSVFVNGASTYIAGQSNDRAAMWVNGVETILNTSLSVANDIFVSGTDVYVCGQKFNAGVFVRVVWKNGIEIPYVVELDKSSNAKSIKVIGNDVYVVGNGVNTVGAFPVSKVWKNGIEITSNIAYLEHVALYIDDTDIYTVSRGGFGGALAAVTKNNISLHEYTATSPNSIFIEGLMVYNKDVYYCGNVNEGIAKYWKNGQETILQADSSAYCYNVFVK